MKEGFSRASTDMIVEASRTIFNSRRYSRIALPLSIPAGPGNIRKLTAILTLSDSRVRTR